MERRPASEADEECAAALEIFVAAEDRRSREGASEALAADRCLNPPKGRRAISTLLTLLFLAKPV